ncbi:hypothetical protein BBC27_05640 [Acidithiobacillus ferrivorans]|uniref:Uncharacterized protein n=1 Tax=Acidithiobacillus ferrivorans TaxID=160808 RepID=A0A1B9C1U2_9PROT|nr:hypothetical protein BBC27_05640 [Acidithiobacillus ferrivorans]
MPFQVGDNVLWVGDGKHYSIGFIAKAAATDGNTIHIRYPMSYILARAVWMDGSPALKVLTPVQRSKEDP